MSKSFVPRDISKMLQMFRQALFSGRVYQTNLRHEDISLAKRTQPLPNIAGGVSHKLNSNYYYNRDARRTSSPPELIQTVKTLSTPNNLQLKSN